MEVAIADITSSMQDDDYDLLSEFDKHQYLKRKDKEFRRKIADGNYRQKTRQLIDGGFRAEGKKALNNLKASFHGIQQILCPFDAKMRSIELLNKTFNLFNNEGHFATWRILQLILKARIFQKSDALRARTQLLARIRARRRELPLYEYDYSTITEASALRVMERSLSKYVYISREMAAILTKKRSDASVSHAKLDLIASRIDRCENMFNCRSTQHYKLSGCPVCGAIRMGTSANGEEGQFFVRSVNVDTGVETLLKLEYEMEQLLDAEERQEAIVAAYDDDVRVYQEDLLMHVTEAVQPWYCCHLARRRCVRDEQARLKSLFYHRIRRLVRMKREVDLMDPFNVDKRGLLYRYSELVPELEEYFALKFVKKNKFIEDTARKFLEKLRIAVVRARRRKAVVHEAEERAAEERRERSMVNQRKNEILRMRKRVELLENRKWVCMRPGCNLRKFFSAQRYRMHMDFHLLDDEKQRKRNEEAAALLLVRNKDAWLFQMCFTEVQTRARMSLSSV
jgi:hypothetical protein